MGLVDDQVGAVGAAELAQLVVIARSGQHHAAVRHDRFGQHAGAILVGQFPLQGVDVVEFDNAAQGLFGDPRIHVVGRAQFELSLRSDVGQGLIEAAVVALVHGEDFGPTGQRPANADDIAVGLGGRHGHLPERQTEAAAQLLADVQGLGGGHHGGDALPNLLRDHFRGGLRGVAEHGPGVAEAEIDVFVAVDVDHTVAVSLTYKDRMGGSPIPHPGHGDAVQQHGLRLVEGFFGRLRAPGKERVFAAAQAAELRFGYDSVGRLFVGNHHALSA